MTSIPARYAVSQAMRDIHASARCNGSDDHWLQRAQGAVSKRLLRADDVERDMLHGPTATSLTTFRRDDGRRLGLPHSTFSVGRLVADRFVQASDAGWGHVQEVVVLRRETVDVRRNHLEERSSPSGLAVARHALERLYERERLDHGSIRPRLLEDLADADRALAFATAAGLFVHGRPFDRDAYTILPLGGGLLIARNVAVAMRKGSVPSTRYVVGRHGVTSQPVATGGPRSLDMGTLHGMPVEGHLLALGMTYLSEDLLYLEQHAYAAAFHREAARHDLDALVAEAGRTWLAHETRPPSPVIKIDGRLRYLLSQIIVPKPPGLACLSIGWSGEDVGSTR